MREGQERVTRVHGCDNGAEACAEVEDRVGDFQLSRWQTESIKVVESMNKALGVCERHTHTIFQGTENFHRKYRVLDLGRSNL